jgi:GMP synthase-like glutamine amidotransferase
MRVQILQHASFEGPGSIAGWLHQKGATFGFTRFWEPYATLPSLDSVDLIIIMGGPMSVNEEKELPWLRQEKAFVREAIRRELPVLGVCLGAQLIASAMGARVYRNKDKEIGWHSVEAVQGEKDLFQFPSSSMVFQWHGETFDLPKGAFQLARSKVCENQAFQMGRRALALQFHLETTPEVVETMIEHCSEELKPAPHIQDAKKMRALPASAYKNLQKQMERVLEYLTRP